MNALPYVDLYSLRSGIAFLKPGIHLLHAPVLVFSRKKLQQLAVKLLILRIGQQTGIEPVLRCLKGTT